ncbi:MAG: hypothetical protein AB7Q29_18810 [Vicinamibacterales bacterium]
MTSTRASSDPSTRASSRSVRELFLDVAVAVFVILVCFPDVLFLGASFRPSEVAGNHLPPREVHAWLPEPEWRTPHGGYNDLGTSLLGLEPAQLFVDAALRRGESVFWNPYSAAGSLGVESLTDSKFSPFSLAVALTGPSSLAFHVCYLAILVFNLTLFARLLRVYFGVGRMGGAVAGLVFVLNGFHLSNLTNILVQPYLFAPMLLTGLFELVDREVPRRRSFVLCTLGHVGVMAPLSPATAILLVGGCYAVTAAQAHSKSAGWNWFAWAAGSGLLSLAILAPILVPTVYSWSYLDTFGAYETRTYESASPLALLSVFTPRHVWESYNNFFGFNHAGDAIDWLEASWVHHIGIVTAVLAMQAVGRASGRVVSPTLVAGLLVVVGIGRAFNHLPFSVASDIPVLRGIQPGYWNCLTGFFGSLLAGVGLSRVWREGARIVPGVAAALTIAGAAGVLVAALGCPSISYLVRPMAVLVGAVTLLAATRSTQFRIPATAALALLLTVELMSYVNTMRPRRLPVATDLAAAIPPPVLHSSFRTLSVGTHLPVEWGAWYRIRQADGFRESELPWYRDFFLKTFGQPGIRQGLSFAWTADGLAPDLARASYLGVRYFVVPARGRNMAKPVRRLRELGLREIYTNGEVAVLENPDAQSRVRLFGALAEGLIPNEPSAADLAHIVFSDDASFVNGARALGIPAAPGTPAVGDEPHVIVIEDRHDSLTVRVHLPRPMVLSVADTWHPRLRAMCDQTPCAVGRLNDAFRGVALSAGDHRVEIRYVALGLPGTYGVSLLAVGLLIAASAPRRRWPAGRIR